MGNLLIVSSKTKIFFELYEKKAQKTIKVILSCLPLSREFVQARFAGEEIWSPNPLKIKLQKENSSKNLFPGEIGFAPFIKSNEVRGAIAIVYGKVKGKNLQKLEKLGKQIWLHGKRKLSIKNHD